MIGARLDLSPESASARKARAVPGSRDRKKRECPMAKVSVSTKLPAPADKVWSLIGGWNTVPDWHPEVEKCETEQGGQVRRLQLTDGAEVTERLEKFDRNARTYTYSITASPLPFTDYRSTITASPAAIHGLSIDDHRS